VQVIFTGCGQDFLRVVSTCAAQVLRALYKDGVLGRTSRGRGEHHVTMKKAGRAPEARRCLEINFETYRSGVVRTDELFLKCDRAMLNLSVLDYPNHADNVKTLTEHVPHPLDQIVPVMNAVLVSVLDPLGLQVILFDYGNLDRTRSDGKIE